MDRKYRDTVIRKELKRAYLKSDMFLQSGLTGICLSLFALYEKTGCGWYKNRAYETLDRICGNLKTSDALGMADGLTGAALGLLYLVEKGYADGNISYILQDIDNHIYKAVVYRIEDSDVKDFHKYESSLLDIIIYTAIRLKKTEMDGVERNIRERFLLSMIDKLYLKHNSDFYKEPFPGSLHYKIPKFLIAMGLSAQVGYCRTRVSHILEECEHRILTCLPYLGFNRLFLYASVWYLEKNFGLNARWKQYKGVLRSSIDIRQIVEDEIPDNDLFLTKGLTGIYFLMTRVVRDIDCLEYRKLIARKIESSELFLRPTDAAVELYDFHGLDGVLGLILYTQMKADDEKKD